MDEPFKCSCLMKTDLENSVDLFAFFEENFPITSIFNDLNKLSYEEQCCACCLMATALKILSRERKMILGWMIIKKS